VSSLFFFVAPSIILSSFSFSLKSIAPPIHHPHAPRNPIIGLRAISGAVIDRRQSQNKIFSTCQDAVTLSVGQIIVAGTWKFPFDHQSTHDKPLEFLSFSTPLPPCPEENR
jgi:hypothetical protein